MRNPNHMPTLQVRLPPALLARYTLAACQTGETLSKVVRGVLERHAPRVKVNTDKNEG